MSLGGHGFAAFAAMTFKVDLNMSSKMHGFPLENDRVHVSLGATDLAHSQK